ncbi:DUF3131 domain-containing protein [Noviherbaspirillum pedocola]|uniref:DUF3131 domain-containing protein n=1 Tax=Noviherbaspirillum pedocola TaxID=2801341 RepID=A0A934W7C4_9BURK|nr:DUF3131 domain-containing protein [Noviherbaspirillum pedocola]MBK4735403.1 DUF3131 domain-containing protein [Noviherbaspirillum pedocola]
MTSPIVKARSTIAFVAALLVATLLAVWIERQSAVGEREAAKHRPGRVAVVQSSPDLPSLPAPRALTDREREWAVIAWRYFERNTDAQTGLVNSVQDYPAATMWDTASYLLALIAAQKIDVIDTAQFNARMDQALRSLARMPLYRDVLPNKSYDTSSLAMADYSGKPAPNGIGWSALDIGRLLVALDIVALQYPEHAEAVTRVVSRYDLPRVRSHGSLVGTSLAADGSARELQEGRLGYEQYAAAGYALYGIDMRDALDYRPHLSWVDVYGIHVPVDDRDPKEFGARNFVVSEPYVLDGLEFGWDSVTQELAWRVYRAQQERFRKTGVPTAVTEDHLDRAPYFAYNAVYSDGRAWNTITENGESLPELRTLSVKAAFGWHALYQSEYSTRLIDAVAGLNDPERGWYAGKYEAGGAPNRSLNANTNAVVLESLAYMAQGRLLGLRKGGGN